MAQYIIETAEPHVAVINGMKQYRVTTMPWILLSEDDLEKLKKVDADFLNEAYSKGLRDGWGTAKEIGAMDDDDEMDVFGYSGGITLEKYDPVQAKKLLREWKEANRIRIGDEVEYYSGGERGAFIVCDFDGRTYGGITTDEDYSTRDGWNYCVADGLAKKTGRSFPEVAALFAKIKGGRNAQIHEDRDSVQEGHNGK